MNIYDLGKKIDDNNKCQNISDDDFDALIDKHDDLFQLLDHDEFNCYYNYSKSLQTIH